MTAGTMAGASANKRRWKLPSFEMTSFMLVFLGVPLAVYIIFVISPFVQAFYYSMTDWSGFTPEMKFIGLDNYLRLLQDGVFLKALGNNLLLVFILPPLTITLSLGLASLVTVGGSGRGEVRGLANSNIYRIVSFFPYVVPAIVIGILWAQIFDPSNGLLNGILTSLGFEQFESYPWLGDQRTALGASMFVMVWSMVGFYMMLFIAAIKGIPADLFEAARLDGAGRFRTIITITIPLIRDHIRTAYIYLGILALDGFVYMQALNPNGGPANSTLVIPQNLLDTAFKKAKFGYASSMGVVLAIVTLTFAAIIFLVTFLLSRKMTQGSNKKTIKPGEAASSSRLQPITKTARPAVSKTPVQKPDRVPSASSRLPESKTVPHSENWKPLSDTIVTILSHATLILWMIIILVPLLWVLVSSFKTTKEIFASPFSLPAVWNFDNYVSAWTTAGIGTYFFNTVIVVASALAIVMILGAMCAYVLARFNFRGSKVLYYLMLAGLAFPVFLAIVPLFFVLKGFGILNTLHGLIITYVAFALPFTVFFLYGFFRSLPNEIAEAAAMDGAGPWRTFFQIMLPMAGPGMASIAIFNFLGLWNQFLLPVALNTRRDNYVLSQGMANFASQAGYAVDFGALFAAVVITVLPVLTVYIIFQRQLQGSVSPNLLK